MRVTKLPASGHRKGFSRREQSRSKSQTTSTPTAQRQAESSDLILQQSATLVLHPAVNYVPFTVTITANGCRAEHQMSTMPPPTELKQCRTPTALLPPPKSSFFPKHRMFLQIKLSPESCISKGRCSGSLHESFSLQVPGVERSFIIPQLSVINETIENPN